MKISKICYKCNNYVHTIITKIGKKKTTTTELIGTDIPLYKRVFDGKNITEYDRNLFGKFDKRV